MCAPRAFLMSVVFKVRPEMKKMTTMKHVCAIGKSPALGEPTCVGLK